MEGSSDPPPRQPVAPADAPGDFRAAYEESLSYVWKVLKRLGVAETELPDTAHDVFAAAYRHWGEYDASRPLRPWLFGIAFRLVLDARRHSRNRVEVVTAQPDAVETRTGEASVLESEGRDLALGILAEMALEQRAVFVMHELEGHSMPEIAEALSVPLNTAYSRLRLARKRFEEAAARIRGKERG